MATPRRGAAPGFGHGRGRGAAPAVGSNRRQATAQPPPVFSLTAAPTPNRSVLATGGGLTPSVY